MYMLFMGPPELDTEWQDASIKGVKNFLNRLWDYLSQEDTILPAGQKADDASVRRFHRFLKAYQDRIEKYRVNTAVSAVMEYLNDLTGHQLKMSREIAEQFLAALSVMVPHIGSELLERLLGKKLQECSWPAYDAALAEVSDVVIAIQVNGKLRGSLNISKGQTHGDVEPHAREAIAKWLEGKTVVKVIYVADRLINFVIR
jgi:leucyl-tRNA synthetase